MYDFCYLAQCFSRSIQTITCISTYSFLLPNDFPLFGWMTFWIIRLPVNGDLDGVHFSAIRNNTALNILV